MDYFAHLGLTEAVHNPFSAKTLIAADLACEYEAPAFFGQTLHAHGRVVRMGRSSLAMEYALVEPESSRLVATTYGNLVYFGHEAGKSTPLTPTIRERIAQREGLTA